MDVLAAKSWNVAFVTWAASHDRIASECREALLSLTTHHIDAPGAQRQRRAGVTKVHWGAPPCRASSRRIHRRSSGPGLIPSAVLLANVAENACCTWRIRVLSH